MLENLLAKSFVAPKIAALEVWVLDTLNKITLQDGETHAAIVSDVDTDRKTGKPCLVLVVAIFKGNTVSRFVNRYNIMEFVNNADFSELKKML